MRCALLSLSLVGTTSAAFSRPTNPLPTDCPLVICSPAPPPAHKSRAAWMEGEWTDSRTDDCEIITLTHTLSLTHTRTRTGGFISWLWSTRYCPNPPRDSRCALWIKHVPKTVRLFFLLSLSIIISPIDCSSEPGSTVKIMICLPMRSRWCASWKTQQHAAPSSAYLHRGSSDPGVRAQSEGGRGCCRRCSLSPLRMDG